MQACDADKMQRAMPDSEDHFLLEPQCDVTKGADKRKVQLVKVKSTSSVCSASEHLHTLVTHTERKSKNKTSLGAQERAHWYKQQNI